MAKSSKKKVIATHPKSKREMKIDTAIYEPFNAAILQSLKGSKGKTFTELTDAVVKIIKKKIPLFDKSIPWYFLFNNFCYRICELCKSFPLTSFQALKNGCIKWFINSSINFHFPF